MGYYEFRDAKVLIAHELMKREGWKIYGYYADDSNIMIDYYSPASWDGLAEKNGYVFVVDRNWNSDSGQEIKKYNYESSKLDKNILDKIEKLRAVTVERGATESEFKTAQEKIELLSSKETLSSDKYIIVGKMPVYQANPPHMKWHLEKDGVILAKGTGISKYSKLKFYNPERDKDNTLESIRQGLKEYYSDETKLNECSQSTFDDILERRNLYKTFIEFINRIDSMCGGMIGDGECVTYEKVTVTEYKKENKVFELTKGEGEVDVEVGAYFKLNTSFNHGCYRGAVYKIEDIRNNRISSYKLNKKLDKLCKGMASSNNTFNTDIDKFNKWIKKGLISMVEIKEVKTPYEVEKLVKKVTKTTNSTNVESKDTDNESSLQYDIKEDIDTRDNSKIFVVKVLDKLERNNYITVNNQMKNLGGYYSKFKHGFIFKDNPVEQLNKIAL